MTAIEHRGALPAGAEAEQQAAGDPTLARLEDAMFRVVRAVWMSNRSLAGTELPVDKTGQALLARLAAAGPQRVSELASCVHLDLSTISRAVRALEDVHLVEREVDPADRRASRLQLSERGRATLAVIRAHRQAVLERALRTWSPADRTTLADLLDRLADAVNDEPTRHRQETL